MRIDRRCEVMRGDWRAPKHGQDRDALGPHRRRDVLSDAEIEIHHRGIFATKARARFAVAEFIEVFCSRKRMHSSRTNSTPAQALTDYRSAAVAV